MNFDLELLSLNRVKYDTLFNCTVCNLVFKYPHSDTFHIMEDTATGYHIKFQNYQAWYSDSNTVNKQFIDILGKRFYIDSLFDKNEDGFDFSFKVTLNYIFEISLNDRKYLCLGFNNEDDNGSMFTWYNILVDISKPNYIHANGFITLTDEYSLTIAGPPLCINDFNNDGKLEFAKWIYEKGKHIVKCYSIDDTMQEIKSYYLMLRYLIEPCGCCIYLDQSHWFFDLAKAYPDKVVYLEDDE